jgi:hypothetical protein
MLCHAALVHTIAIWATFLRSGLWNTWDPIGYHFPRVHQCTRAPGLNMGLRDCFTYCISQLLWIGLICTWDDFAAAQTWVANQCTFE